MKRFALLAAVLPLFVLAAPARAEDYPAPQGFVVDTAGVIPATVEASLERELSSYSRRTTNQIGIAVLRTLDGADLDDYATTLFNRWGIGQRGKDNGVLVLVAVDDHLDRITIGRGLTTRLTEAERRVVLDDLMRPSLRAGNYAGAVQKAERAIRADLGDRSVEAGPPPAMSPFRGGHAAYQDGGSSPAAAPLVEQDPPLEVGGPGIGPAHDSGPSPGLFFVVAIALAAVGLVLRLVTGFRGGGGGGGRTRGGFWSGAGGGLGSGSSWSSGDSGGGSSGSGFGGGSSGGDGSSGSW